MPVSIAGEFGCAGLNTNSFLNLVGGFDRGRPNACDLEREERMNSARKSATLTGALLFIATAAAFIGDGFMGTTLRSIRIDHE
jgi:hypothetical protein